MKVKIKKYWKVYCYVDGVTKDRIYKEILVEGRNVQNAVDNFYKKENGWCYRSNYFISKVEPLTIEVKDNG